MMIACGGRMTTRDKSGGQMGVSCHLNVALTCLLLAAITTVRAEERRQFYKPPSPCLTGPSCEHCVDTATFYNQQVCCYHCRLDNVVINNHICHCIDTRLPDSMIDVGGNCSSGQICSNCAVQISTDGSEGAEASPGITQFCCQDCGIVMPYLHRDEKGCHCDGDSQGRQHQAAPRYDPSQDTTSITPLSDPNSGQRLLTALPLSVLLYLWTYWCWTMVLFVHP